MPVVRKVEACGSSSGRTRQPVTVADCGELPSRRQILAKIQAEKQALADMKKDPLLVRGKNPFPRGQREMIVRRMCSQQRHSMMPAFNPWLQAGYAHLLHGA
jgi:hypothetical protein